MIRDKSMLYFHRLKYMYVVIFLTKYIFLNETHLFIYLSQITVIKVFKKWRVKENMYQIIWDWEVFIKI